VIHACGSRPEIDWDRHLDLLACPVYVAWNTGLSPALARVVRMVPRNEGLTHWTVTKLAAPPFVRRGPDIVSYEVGLVTPPGRVEWLDPNWVPVSWDESGGDLR
jgi:hypothetical protein